MPASAGHISKSPKARPDKVSITVGMVVRVDVLRNDRVANKRKTKVHVIKRPARFIVKTRGRSLKIRVKPDVKSRQWLTSPTATSLHR